MAELYTTHEGKPQASHYPLFFSPVYGGYLNGEPGSEQIENDPQHELAGERMVDYDIWLEIVAISEGLYLGKDGTWYDQPGQRVHLSHVPFHHVHLDYWVFPEDYGHDVVFYVVFRLLDELADARRYEPSQDFWVVLNRSVPGDFNSDGHIDLVDFERLHACAVEQNAGGCVEVDLDGDGRVSLIDFGLFQQRFSGPTEHADPRRAFLADWGSDGQ